MVRKMKKSIMMIMLAGLMLSLWVIIEPSLCCAEPFLNIPNPHPEQTGQAWLGSVQNSVFVVDSHFGGPYDMQGEGITIDIDGNTSWITQPPYQKDGQGNWILWAQVSEDGPPETHSYSLSNKNNYGAPEPTTIVSLLFGAVGVAMKRRMGKKR
jgi:hypothetical protein